MAEGAPLLREYTLKAYRGFESLLLRQINEKGALWAPFSLMGERDDWFEPSFDKLALEASLDARSARSARGRPKGQNSPKAVLVNPSF